MYQARPQPDEIEDMKKALYAACSGKNPITEGNCFLSQPNLRCILILNFFSEMRSNAKNGVFSEDRNFKVSNIAWSKPNKSLLTMRRSDKKHSIKRYLHLNLIYYFLFFFFNSIYNKPCFMFQVFYISLKKCWMMTLNLTWQVDECARSRILFKY